jgi:hypothetical protein
LAQKSNKHTIIFHWPTKIQKIYYINSKVAIFKKKKKKPTNIVNNTQLQLFGEGCVILIKGSFETIVLISTILKINFFFNCIFERLRIRINF